MRKALIVGLLFLVLASGAGAWFALHAGDPVASAEHLMARGDMRGAELYLRQAQRAHPANPEVAFLLGRADLGLGNPQAAELELRRAQQGGYSHAATVLPLGQAYLQQRHFDAALRDFDDAGAPTAERADRLTIRAAAQLALGDTAGATATAAEAEHLAPAGRETLLTAAQVALARGDLAMAADRARQLLARTPNDPDALLLHSQVAMRRNDVKAALADTQAVLAASPGRLDAQMLRARLLAALGQPDAARRTVAQVLQAAPRSADANFLGAMLAIQARDYPAADAMLTQISTVLGQLPRGDYFLAVTKLGLGEPAQAEEAVSRFLAHAPADQAGLKLLAFVDLARARPQAALATLQHGPLAAQPDADTLDLTGRAQAMSGDLAAASGSFTAASKLAPGDTAILNRLAAAQLDLGDSAAAETELKRSLAITPDQPVAGEALVQTALLRGDYAAAAAGVERLRHASGDNEAVGVLGAQVKLASLDLEGAAAQLRDVLRRLPDSRAAALALARVEGLRGHPDAAQAELEALLSRHPDDQAALAAVLPVLFARHKPDRALALAEAAHAAAADNVEVIAALAATYVRAGQAGRAVALLDRASAGTNPQLTSLLARVLAEDGKTDQAEGRYRDILRQAPGDLRTRADLAALLARAKRYDDARAVLQDGLARTPGNAMLLGATVGIDLRQGGITRALSGIAALRTDPRNLPAANALTGQAWLAAGDQRQAAAAFTAAYHAAPTGELATRAASALSVSGSMEQAIGLLSAWVAAHPRDVAAQAVLGSLYITTRQLTEAEQHLDAVLAMRGTDSATLNNLAWVKQQQGDATLARSLAERAYFQAPSPQVADTLGWILARAGEPQRALPLLAQAAADTNPASQPAAAYHYGYALHAAGRADEARTQLARAAQAKADFPEKADAEKLLASLK